MIPKTPWKINVYRISLHSLEQKLNLILRPIQTQNWITNKSGNLFTSINKNRKCYKLLIKCLNQRSSVYFTILRIDSLHWRISCNLLWSARKILAKYIKFTKYIQWIRYVEYLVNCDAKYSTLISIAMNLLHNMIIKNYWVGSS